MTENKKPNLKPGPPDETVPVETSEDPAVAELMKASVANSKAFLKGLVVTPPELKDGMAKRRQEDQAKRAPW